MKLRFRIISKCTTTNIPKMLLTMSYSESANPITPVEPLKSRFSDYSEIVYNLFLKTTIMYLMLWTVSYSESPVSLSRTVESTSLRLLWNFRIFCSRYIHTNSHKFICIWQVQNCEIWIHHIPCVLPSFIKIVYFVDKPQV